MANEITVTTSIVATKDGVTVSVEVILCEAGDPNS